MKASSESGECARTMAGPLISSLVSSLIAGAMVARTAAGREREETPLVKKKMLASEKKILLEFLERKKAAP